MNLKSFELTDWEILGSINHGLHRLGGFLMIWFEDLRDGQAGVGKTWLINKMAEVAENYPCLKCGWVRYEVTPTDSVDSTMVLMVDNAFEAA